MILYFCWLWRGNLDCVDHFFKKVDLRRAKLPKVRTFSAKLLILSGKKGRGGGDEKLETKGQETEVVGKRVEEEVKINN